MRALVAAAMAAFLTFMAAIRVLAAPNVPAPTPSPQTESTSQPQQPDPFWPLASAARQDAKALAADQFAKVSSHTEEIDKPFTIIIKRSNGADTDFTGDYTNGILHLALHTGLFKYDPYSLFGNTKTVPSITVAQTVTNQGSYVGENGFGAKTNVDSITWNGTFLAAMALPASETSSFLSSYEWRAALDSDDAKQIFQSSEAVIQGLIATLPNGKVAECTIDFSAPTMDVPISSKTDGCYVAAKVWRIAFISRGQVLKMWVSHLQLKGK